MSQPRSPAGYRGYAWKEGMVTWIGVETQIKTGWGETEELCKAEEA